jgi:hypothetical protein
VETPPVHGRETPLQKSTGRTKAKPNSGPREQSLTYIVWKATGGFEPPKAIPERPCIDIGRAKNVSDIKTTNPLPLEESEDPKTSVIVPMDNTDNKTPYRDFHGYRIDQLRQDTKFFSESHLQVMLNLGLPSAF